MDKKRARQGTSSVSWLSYSTWHGIFTDLSAPVFKQFLCVQFQSEAVSICLQFLSIDVALPAFTKHGLDTPHVRIQLSLNLPRPYDWASQRRQITHAAYLRRVAVWILHLKWTNDTTILQAWQNLMPFPLLSSRCTDLWKCMADMCNRLLKFLIYKSSPQKVQSSPFHLHDPPVSVPWYGNFTIISTSHLILSGTGQPRLSLKNVAAHVQYCVQTEKYISSITNQKIRTTTEVPKSAVYTKWLQICNDWQIKNTELKQNAESWQDLELLMKRFNVVLHALYQLRLVFAYCSSDVWSNEQSVEAREDSKHLVGVTRSAKLVSETSRDACLHAINTLLVSVDQETYIPLVFLTKWHNDQLQRTVVTS